MAADQPPRLPTPRKRFGQHFLHDPGVIARIVAAVAPAADDAIVEIGPGEGALTRALLARMPHLTAIEINATYYGSQKPESFRKWAREVPNGFLFSVKGSRFTTNRRELKEAGESLKRFFSVDYAGCRAACSRWARASRRSDSRQCEGRRWRCICSRSTQRR